MSLDDIWNEPIASPPKLASPTGDDSTLKRPREPLFLADSDTDGERPPKRATPAPLLRPDVDALFDDLDKEEEDLTYKPLAPALDLARLAKEAQEKHARARQAGPSQTLASSSRNDSFAKSQEKDKAEDGEKKGRRVLPKLDEERLVGPEGFPLLIEQIKGFKPKGKGNEHTDLNRLLQVYQFWAHRMYPKTSFKDTINRVEKLCHSKRMQVRLSVWRDEFKGITNDKKSGDDSDIIDLTEPTLVGTEQDGEEKESQDLRSKSDPASSRPSSLPPASSEVDDDDFDIEAVIRAEEERLSALRATTTDSSALNSLPPPPVPEKAPSKGDTDTNAMDLDEASLWDAVDDSAMVFDLPESNLPPPAPQSDDEDVWDIVDQIERGQSKPPSEMRIPVNATPSSGSAQSGDTYRPTNEEDWEDMYL